MLMCEPSIVPTVVRKVNSLLLARFFASDDGHFTYVFAILCSVLQTYTC